MKQYNDKKGKNVLFWVLAVVGAIAAVAGIAYAVYRLVTRDHLEDLEEGWEDDEDFIDEDEFAEE